MEQNPRPIKAVKLVAVLLLISLCVSMFSCRNETPPKEEDAPNDSVQPEENKKEPQENKKAFRDNEDLGQLYCALVDNEILRPRSVALVGPYYYSSTDSRIKQNKSYAISGEESVKIVISMLDEIEKHCTLVQDREVAVECLPAEQFPKHSMQIDRSSIYLLHARNVNFRISVYERHVVISNGTKTHFFDTDISMRYFIEEIDKFAQTGELHPPGYDFWEII